MSNAETSVRNVAALRSSQEGKQLGKNGVAAVKSKKMAESGVDQWRRQNKAVKELFEEHKALEAMFVEMAHEVVRTAPWGLLWRVSLGAVLSLIDVATDINVTLGFRNAGKKQAGYFHGMVASLGVSVAMQCCVTIIQNKKRGFHELATEIVWTLMFALAFGGTLCANQIITAEVLGLTFGDLSGFLEVPWELIFYENLRFFVGLF